IFQKKNPERLVPGVAIHLGQFGQALRAVYSLANEGLAAGKLDSLGDSKSHERGGPGRYRFSSTPPQNSLAGPSVLGSQVSAAVSFGRLLDASIAGTVPAPRILGNAAQQVALARVNLAAGIRIHHAQREALGARGGVPLRP